MLNNVASKFCDPGGNRELATRIWGEMIEQKKRFKELKWPWLNALTMASLARGRGVCRDVKLRLEVEGRG